MLTVDARFSFGTEKVKYFNKEVSPFAGFHQDYNNGFDDLYNLLPARRNILYATPQLIKEPKGWKIVAEINGLQFVFHGKANQELPSLALVPLNNTHIEEMIQLATLTKPGPFGPRTIEFGHYHGIFENRKLVAMTGQRLHVTNYTEISAVCTHPDHLGKGYAAALISAPTEFNSQPGPAGIFTCARR